MGLLDKAKAAAEQAASKAKETAGELQTKRELGQAYDELGRKTYELVEAGGGASSVVHPPVERDPALSVQLNHAHARPPAGATPAQTAARPPAEPAETDGLPRW